MCDSTAGSQGGEMPSIMTFLAHKLGKPPGRVIGWDLPACRSSAGQGKQAVTHVSPNWSAMNVSLLLGQTKEV